jgi:SAM-dependent methyltransferase
MPHSPPSAPVDTERKERPEGAEGVEGAPSYDDRLLAEQTTFSGCQAHHALPAIFGYWSYRYLRPQLASLGFDSPESMFGQHFLQAYRAGTDGRRRFVSLGSGTCETEIRIARFMTQQGCDDFTIECVEMNAMLVAQGSASAAEAGVTGLVVPVQGDFNQWAPTQYYDGVLANNSLHHVLNLEDLFTGIQQHLLPTGTFVTSDMIGRNGHMRWPEALAIVHEFWRELPRHKTFNHLLQRHEDLYENWDCSTEGFEGIRAQDILPLLIECFEFDAFLPFANVIDPFVDRTFGPNFSATDPDDRTFIDRVHERDAHEIARGAIKPTHILAAMCVGRAGLQKYVKGLTPAFSVRSPKRAPIATYVPATPAAKTGTRPTPKFDYSDLWWNPLEPGWGLAIHQHPGAALVATWLTYRADRTSIWYSIQPGRWLDDGTYEGLLYEAEGPRFEAPANQDPAQLRQVGTAIFAFSSEWNGIFSCAIGDRTWSSAICRMEF